MICGTQYACANYPNFRRIEVDLNSGVAGAQQIYLYYREDNPESEPITGLQVGTVLPNETDWVRLDVSLNAGMEGKDLWLYYTKSKATSKSPVDSIIVKKGKHPVTRDLCTVRIYRCRRARNVLIILRKDSNMLMY